LAGKITTGYTGKDKQGRWFARLTFTDSSGKRKNIQRRAENATAAKQLLRELLRSLEDHGEKTFKADQMTFNDLAEYFTANYLKPAEYSSTRKISGMRSHKEATSHFKPVKEWFGDKKIKSISHADIINYKLHRLKTPIITVKKDAEGKPIETQRPRTITTVNRELSLLRRVLQIAVDEGWLNRSPFAKGDLISTADEVKRERILSRQEEKELLAQCVEERVHLKAIIICALDTGMRQGEIFSLCWKDINFDNGLITIQAFNTKTSTSRQVALSYRLKQELEALHKLSTGDPDAVVFGVKSIKRSFATACKLAKIKDLRFHDLRHTAATRLIQQGLPLQEVGRILGHTQANTTYRYVNANTDTARRAAEALNQFHAQKPEKKEKQEEGEKKELIN